MVHLSATKRNTHVITAEFANLWIDLGLRALARDGMGLRMTWSTSLPWMGGGVFGIHNNNKGRLAKCGHLEDKTFLVVSLILSL